MKRLNRQLHEGEDQRDLVNLGFYKTNKSWENQAVQLEETRREGWGDGERRNRTDRKSGFPETIDPPRAEGANPPRRGVLTTFGAGPMDPQSPHLPTCKLKGCNSSQGFW